MERKKFYITTTLPYINSDPHIGFAAEIIRADVIARKKRKEGFDVTFNTGTDEHGLKIYQKAQEESLSVQDFCDRNSAKFLPLKEKLDLSYDRFIRTTDERHKEAVRKFWQICQENGDIYKKKYQVKYCVGCEMEKTDSELENGFCPFHPGKELETIYEENYFFKFSKYQKDLLDLYKKNPDIVKPESRLKEIESFVSRGLNDFSISRIKEKMPHGIAVPGDDSQVVYVWFDALVNYISTLGWPNNEDDFKSFWPAVQVCGKDNLRQQTAMWQSMLLSAGIENSKQVLVFGFLTANGQKISKSLGNGVNLYELIDKFGSDAVRYYLLSEIPCFDDGDYSLDKFIDRYNSDLANGLGNLSARVSNLLEKNEIETNLKIDLNDENIKDLVFEFEQKFKDYKFNECLQLIWKKISYCDEILTKTSPWKISDKKEIEKILKPIAQTILNISDILEIFIPKGAGLIKECFLSAQIKKLAPIFPRLIKE